MLSLDVFSEKLRKIISEKYKKNTDFYRDFHHKFNEDIENTCKQWLKGNNYPKTDTLMKVCNILDCDFEYFLTEQKEFKRTDKTISDLLGLSVNSIKTLEKLDDKYLNTLNFIMQDFFTFSLFLSNIHNFISGDFDTPIYFERDKNGKGYSEPKIGVDIKKESPLSTEEEKKKNYLYIQNSSSKDKGYITIPVSMTKTFFMDCIRKQLELWEEESQKEGD